MDKGKKVKIGVRNSPDGNYKNIKGVEILDIPAEQGAPVEKVLSNQEQPTQQSVPNIRTMPKDPVGLAIDLFPELDGDWTTMELKMTKCIALVKQAQEAFR